MELQCLLKSTQQFVSFPPNPILAGGFFSSKKAGLVLLLVCIVKRSAGFSAARQSWILLLQNLSALIIELELFVQWFVLSTSFHKLDGALGCILYSCFYCSPVVL